MPVRIKARQHEHPSGFSAQSRGLILVDNTIYHRHKVESLSKGLKTLPWIRLIEETRIGTEGFYSIVRITKKPRVSIESDCCGPNMFKKLCNLKYLP